MSENFYSKIQDPEHFLLFRYYIILLEEDGECVTWGVSSTVLGFTCLVFNKYNHFHIKVKSIIVILIDIVNILEV